MTNANNTKHIHPDDPDDTDDTDDTDEYDCEDELYNTKLLLYIGRNFWKEQPHE